MVRHAAFSIAMKVDVLVAMVRWLRDLLWRNVSAYMLRKMHSLRQGVSVWERGASCIAIRKFGHVQVNQHAQILFKLPMFAMLC
jgi:hypothetical protein